ncbi:class GN sortase [Cohaesibacter haloalkalitolerans]|uniref:class GN sortase n=1 Tax=Cohaesibacter haloalkalitolerans TaxID=1162980 RepID=UPI000E653ED0|nr:class GN sortase [Cohaesibacter haloalkalitolerans]
MRYPRPTQYKLGTLGAVALGLLGLGLLLWGSWIPIKAQLAQVLLERAWQQSRTDGKPHKAWPWADSWPVARLTIPSLDLHTIILKEAGGEGLAFGPVLLAQGAPLGTAGTSIIAAHRDTHFQPLQHLQTGALVEVEQMTGPTLTYRIDGSKIVRWDQSGLQKDSQSPLLVLSSCWPFNGMVGGPLRYLAFASPTEATARRLANATSTVIQHQLAAFTEAASQRP